MIKQTDDRKLWYFCAIIVAAAMIFFSPCLKAGYLNWDDQIHFIKNASVQRLDFASLRAMFTGNINGTYIPLTSLSFAIEKLFFGFQPVISHLINMLFHAAVGIVAMFLGIRLGLRPVAAFLGALLFVLHPMHVESVAWVTERKDVLYALFYLLSLHAWWNWMAHSRKRYWLAAFVCGALSLFAKPMAVTLPLVMLLLAWYRDGKWRVRLVAIAPFLLLAIGIGSSTHALNLQGLSRPLGEDLLLRLWSLGFYLWKFFFPVGVYPFYDIPTPISLGYWPYSLCVLFLGTVGYLFWRWRSDRLLLLAGGWYALSIFIVLLANTIYSSSVVADRFMYLPSLGFCFWVAAWAADRLVRPAVRVAIGAVLLSLGMMTFYQCHIWQNSETLWTFVIRQCSNSGIAYYNRGQIYARAGRYDLALKDHEMALAYCNDLALKQHPMALAFCRDSLNEAHNYYARGSDYHHLADRALSEGRKNEAQSYYRLAEQDFDQVVRLGFARVMTYQQRGESRFQLGDFSGAVSDFSNAIQRDAQNAEVFIDRGNAYAALGDLDRALQDLGRAIDLAPSSPDGHESRGVVLIRMGKTVESLADLNQALKLDPQYGQAYYDRSLVKFRQGDLDDARQDALRARALGVAVAEEYLKKLIPPDR